MECIVANWIVAESASLKRMDGGCLTEERRVTISSTGLSRIIGIGTYIRYRIVVPQSTVSYRRKNEKQSSVMIASSNEYQPVPSTWSWVHRFHFQHHNQL